MHRCAKADTLGMDGPEEKVEKTGSEMVGAAGGAAVGAVDEIHLGLLERFRWSANKLGLGDGKDPSFDKPVMGMNSAQLEMVVPELKPVLDSLIGTLESQGLLTRQESVSGGLGGGR